jgi:hypothetical protein
MMFDHLRLRRFVPLLAADALTGAERARVSAHVSACGLCRAEHDGTRAFLNRLGHDPLRAAVREAEVPVSSSVLRARVDEAIDRALIGRRASVARPWVRRAALAAGLAVAIAVPALVARLKERVPEPAAITAEVSAEALTRLERNVAREQTARYLNEAQDVLATVASSPRDCERAERRVDIEAESRRSRELLARGPPAGRPRRGGGRRPARPRRRRADPA